MAEIVGAVASALALATLFKHSIEAFDTIKMVKNQALDFKKVTLRLNIEKCRLYIWGQAMGLASTGKPSQQVDISHCPCPELISETLSLIIDMFKDTEKLKARYGCTNVGDPDLDPFTESEPRDNVLRHLNTSFSNFDISSELIARHVPLVRKTYWVVRDRKRFEVLINEAKGLIDGLQDITRDIVSPALHSDAMTFRIGQISDVRTLDWVSQVCEGDYPVFSDVASSKADVITDIGTLHRDILEWKENVAPQDKSSHENDVLDIDTAIANLEDMTVTELKHNFRTYLLRSRELRQSLSNENSSKPSKQVVKPVQARYLIFNDRTGRK